MPLLTAALKEWAVAVDALTRGETILLLRKGGIREQGGGFAVAHHRIWLYPTYEHQKPQLLKPVYASQVMPVPSGWHPETIAIQSWAEITDALEISNSAALESLLPFHIWTSDFAAERLKWKPRSPLSVLLLRVYALPEPQILPYRSNYGGCKSWIELEAEGLDATDAALPVLSDASYQQQVEDIKALCASQPSA